MPLTPYSLFAWTLSGVLSVGIVLLFVYVVEEMLVKRRERRAAAKEMAARIASLEKLKQATDELGAAIRAKVGKEKPPGA